MSTLIVELRQGETMIVNGAPIRFRTKTRVELTTRTRFLFGKQIMPAEEADTPARRVYFALQCAYVGTEQERASGLALARERVKEFTAANGSATLQAMLDQAMAAAEADDCYAALKLVRRVIQEEDAATGRSPERPTIDGA